MTAAMPLPDPDLPCVDIQPPDAVKAKSDSVASMRERKGYMFMSIARMPSTILVVGYFLPYIALLGKMNVGENGKISVFGIYVQPSSLPLIFTMLFSALSVLLCPIVGAIADCSPHRRRMLGFASFSSAAALGLSLFVTVHHSLWWLGGIVITATLVFSTASDLLVNSYLPEITFDDAQRSKLSAKANLCGFTMQVAFAGMVYLAVSHGKSDLSIKGGLFDMPNDSAKWLIRDGRGDLSSTMVYEMCGKDGRCMQKSTHQFPASHYMSLVIGPSFALHQKEQLEGPQLHSRWVRLNAVLKTDEPAGFSGAEVQLRLWPVNGNQALPVIQSEWQTINNDVLRLVTLENKLPADTTKLFYEVAFRSSSETTKVKIEKIEVISKPNNGIPFAVAACGIWYCLWTFFAIRKLGKRSHCGDLKLTFCNLIGHSFVELGHRIRRTCHNSRLSRFMIALALYSASAGTSVTMATTFFTNNLGIANGTAGIILCCAILCGAMGAFLYAWMGSKIGYGRALAVSYFQWIVTLLLTYSCLHGPKDIGWMFLIVPILGLCFGGSLTLARSVYASMIEPGTEAEMFGMFNFCQCSLGWAAILLFTLVNEWTNCLRTGFLSQIALLLPALLLQLSIEFDWRFPKQKPDVPLDSVAESR